MFAQAIVRPPAPNFAKGLTTAGLGTPDYERALAQHDAYCAALQYCGLKITRLQPDPNYPDSGFVEDVAVTIGQNRDNEAEKLDAIGNLPDLLLAVAPRVGRVQLELVDVTINDLQLETEFRAVSLGSQFSIP